MTRMQLTANFCTLSMDSQAVYPSAGSAKARQKRGNVREGGIAGPPRPHHKRPWCWQRRDAHTRCPSPEQDGRLPEPSRFATSARATAAAPFAADLCWHPRPHRTTPPCLARPERSQSRQHAEREVAASCQQRAISTTVTTVATIGRDAVDETQAAALGWKEG